MFGYVTVNRQGLTQEEFTRFRSMYCGLCRTLRRRYGNVGRLALSYDMTFLAMLLGGLYEPAEETGEEICPPHPLKRHPYVQQEFLEYAADLNVALAYYKCLDNWADERSLAGRAGAKLLERGFRQVRERLPDKCGAIESWLARQGEIERAGTQDVDLCANLTGSLLGELYAFRDDEWGDTLRGMGEAMGRFIYFMDAYEDLPEDIRRRRFNPLRDMSRQPDYEAVCRDVLTLLISDATERFESLPILKDASILRNVLYSGVWTRYAMLQANKEKKTHGKGREV